MYINLAGYSTFEFRLNLFPAMIVRFLTKRFIGEYDPNVGTYVALTLFILQVLQPSQVTDNS